MYLLLEILTCLTVSVVCIETVAGDSRLCVSEYVAGVSGLYVSESIACNSGLYVSESVAGNSDVSLPMTCWVMESL